MATESDTRNFALREDDGSESSTFSGQYPRQAALKAARRLDPADSEPEAKSNAEFIELREKGTDKVHVYEGWAWEEEAPDDGPEWLGDTVSEANVEKQGVKHLD